MEHISKIIPAALESLPEPSKDNSESPSPQEISHYPNSSARSEKGNLRTAWQRKFLQLDTTTPAVQAMADAAESWCKRVYERRDPKLLVLSGTFGCGKTHILRRCSEFVRLIYMTVWGKSWPKPITSGVMNFPAFVREVTENQNREIYEDAVNSDVVFIDDAGAEEDRFRSGAPARVLGDLLGALEKDYVFITTNIPPDAWRERWDGRVEDRLLRRGAVVIDGYDPKFNSVSYAQWILQK